MNSSLVTLFALSLLSSANAFPMRSCAASPSSSKTFEPLSSKRATFGHLRRRLEERAHLDFARVLHVDDIEHGGEVLDAHKVRFVDPVASRRCRG